MKIWANLWLGTLILFSGGCFDDSNERKYLEDSIVIDVRTPSEFAEGHLESALNLDYQSPDFASDVNNLPRDGNYFLYCRSGSRSGQAVSIMAELGFKNLSNGGGLEEASRTSGLSIVTK